MSDESGGRLGGGMARKRACEACRKRRKRCTPSSIGGTACHQCISRGQAATCEFSSPPRSPVDEDRDILPGSVDSQSIPRTPSSVLSRGHFEETIVSFQNVSIQVCGACIGIDQLYYLFDLWYEYERTISREGLGGALLRASTAADIEALTNTYCATCAFASGTSCSSSDQMVRCWNWVNLALRMGMTLVAAYKSQNQKPTEVMCMASLHLFIAVMYSKFPAHASMELLVAFVAAMDSAIDADELETWDYCEQMRAIFDLSLLRLDGFFERGRNDRIKAFQKHGSAITPRKLHSLCMEIIAQTFIVYQAAGQLDLRTGALDVCADPFELDVVFKAKLAVLVEDISRIIVLCQKWDGLPEMRRCHCLLLLHLAYAHFMLNRDDVVAAEYARYGMNLWLVHGESCHPANALSSNEFLMGVAVLGHLDPGWLVEFVIARPYLVTMDSMEHFSVRGCQNVFKLSKLCSNAMARIKSATELSGDEENQVSPP